MGRKKKTDIEEIIRENQLYWSLLDSSADGIILWDDEDKTVLTANRAAKRILPTVDFSKRNSLDDIFGEDNIRDISEGNTVQVETETCMTNVFSSPWKGRYIWIYVSDLSHISQIEDTSQKILKLNRDLIEVFDTYADETMVVTDGKGIIEFAGAKIAETCGTPISELIGRSVFDVEKEKIFYPSVSAMVIRSKRYETVIQRTKAGAELVSVGAPVINKNGELEKVVSITRDYSAQIQVSTSIAELGDKIAVKDNESDTSGEDIITCNDKMFAIKTMLRMIAPTDATVLITGESGTGKEVLARYLYKLSDRKDKPFVRVNCGAISPTIIESELFGYEEGSFTGARKGGKTGLIEAANGGTLFLDEISELPMDQQVKLLHVLQERTLTKVGGIEPVDLDVRFIAATNKDLEEEISKGTFREDLYYRLNVIPVPIPPLRERKEDIPLLVRHFFTRDCSEYGKDMRLSKDVINMLQDYSWPGNIRQLENAVERIVLTGTSKLITRDDVSLMLPEKGSEPREVYRSGMTLAEAVEAVEKRIIEDALRKHGTMSKTAEALGVNQSTISRKIARYSESDSEGDDSPGSI